MSERGKGMALAISVILNVVLIGAIVAGLWMAREAWRDRLERRGPPLYVAARSLPKTEQDKLRNDMRAAALAARGDFHQARELRRKAAQLAAAPAYDRAAVLAALQGANAAEMRGRSKLDDRLTTVFQGLNPQARKTLAPGFEHRSRRLRDHGRDRPPPEAVAPAAPAAR